MRVALVNPPWTLRRQHLFRLPRAASAAGIRLRPGAAEREPATRPRSSTRQLDGFDTRTLSRRGVADFAPDMTVVTTAPSYLFWRCAPPELRVPQQTLAALRRDRRASPSRSDRTARRRRAIDAAQARRRCGASWANARRCWSALADTPRRRGAASPACCWRDGDDIVVQGGPQAVDMTRLPALALAGRDRSRGIATTTIASTRRRPAPAPKWRRRAAVPITAPSAPRTISATATAAGRLPTILDELDGLIAAGRRPTSISSTRSFCRGASCSRRSSSGRSSSACRPASICGAATCSTCSAAPAASRSRPVSRA